MNARQHRTIRLVAAAAAVALAAPPGAFADGGGSPSGHELSNPVLQNDVAHNRAPSRSPAAVVVRVDGGFDWVAAGVGVAGGLGIALAGGAAAAGIRRRPPVELADRNA